MTTVSADKQGLYVMAGDRVGRPASTQGAGLSAGGHVRAMLTEDGTVRVRYGGKEEFWPAYISRRAPVITPGYNADGTCNFQVGQTWKTRGGSTVKIQQLYSPQDADYARGRRAVGSNGAAYCSRGLYENGAYEGKYDVVAFVSGPG